VAAKNDSSRTSEMESVRMPNLRRGGPPLQKIRNRSIATVSRTRTAVVSAMCMPFLDYLFFALPEWILSDRTEDFTMQKNAGASGEPLQLRKVF
jgi:hypothetical protein